MGVDDDDPNKKLNSKTVDDETVVNVDETPDQTTIDSANGAASSGGGAKSKTLLCVKCEEDAKSDYHSLCVQCERATHFKCLDSKRFTNEGDYKCVKCWPPKNYAKEKIYVSLTSELAYFIGNVSLSETVKIPYENLTHESCNAKSWPKAEKLAHLANLIADEEEHTCSQCNNEISHEKTLICKGCLNITHSECCFDDESNEKACENCSVLNAKKNNAFLNAGKSTSMRRVRDRKEEMKQSHIDKRESVKRTSKLSASNVREMYVESDDERNPLRRTTNVTPLATSSPHMLNDRSVIDQLNRMQLNQLLHKNLPPLYKFSQWDSFYKAYEETKGEFSHSQNVERLKNAIKCQIVKDWGKTRLFELETYDERIQYINRTYNVPELVLDMELEKLTQRKRIASHERERLAEFINDVDDFCVMQLKKGTATSQRDIKMLRTIMNVLPREMAESYVNRVNEREGWTLNITTLNKFLQDKMVGLIFANPGIIMKSEKSDHKQADENQNSHKFKRNSGNFNAHNNAALKTCGFCDDNRHRISRCYKALKLSGSELIKRLKEKRICVVCGQEPYSGNGHKCSNPSDKFCNKTQHKDIKHYEILCGLREPSSPQNNHQQDNVGGNQNANRNANNNTRGRGRGNGRSQNNSRQPQPNQSFLNQNNNENSQSIPFNNNASNNNNGNQVAASNATNGAVFTTFSGAYFNMNKVDQAQWKTSETLLPVVVIKVGKERKPVSFLLDSGSSISLIEDYVADYFKENGLALPLTLNWSGDVNYYHRKDPNSRVVSLEAEAYNGTTRIMHFHTFNRLAIAPQTLDVEEVKSRLPYLQSLNLSSYQKIHGVIGQDQVNFFRVLQQFGSDDGNEDCYLGFVTPMGDYISGTRFSIATLYQRMATRNLQNQNGPFNTFNAIKNMHNTEVIDQKELEMLEERLMGGEYFEEPPINDRACADDLYATTVLEREMYKDDNGKFVAPLIFKEETPNLPALESYCAAKKRHYALTTMLKKHEKFDEVNDEIKKLLSKGYCEKVPKSQLRSYDLTYYLPIFCISPPNKRTRVIWDGKAVCSTGESLNSFLLPGPNLYNNLIQIYLNMRSERVLIVGDLEEMFHQIIIKREHRDALRFLWADELNKPPEVYRMTRLVFGLNCAPFMAQFAVKLTVKSIKHSHPQISRILELDIYMDDVATSVRDVATGQNIVLDLKTCLRDAGFNLVKLKSSNPKVFEKLIAYLTANELAHEKLFPEGNMHRILGYLNDFDQDTFGLGINYEKYAKFVTEEVYPNKRDVLVLSRSIYDPLGLFVFLTAKFKYIYHLVCCEKIDWEHPIPQDIFKLWKQAIAWLVECRKLQIPRCYVQSSDDTQIKQLWAFSDASDHACCVVIYYRLINSDRSQVDVSLVFGKDFIISKQAHRTIPELELEAATRAVLLLNDIVKLSTKIKFDEIYLVVDNSSVLNWLIYGLEKPTVYVKNRLKKINEVDLKITYKWVNTENQAADYGTKFSSMPAISAENDWFYPKLFRLAEEDWPTDQFLKKKENHVMVTGKSYDNDVDWERFSSFNRLVESFRELFSALSIKVRENRFLKLRENNNTAKTRRQKKIYKSKCDDMLENIALLKSDPTFKREEAKRFVIMRVQAEYFKKEIEIISSGSQLPLSHPLGKLLLRMKNGILCNTSRLPENIMKEERFKNFNRDTIMLPKEHHVTKLIILQAHTDNNHFHIDTTIAMLTKEYYILHIRTTVIKVIRENCFLCRKINRKPHAPLCGDLPVEKLCVDHSPFTNVMIDMAGPYMVKTRKTRNDATLKRYLLVVICLTTRAMHIEIMNDASSDSFIKALLITFELRGYPKKIICDRGTNFVGADNSLKKLMNDHNQMRMLKGLTPIKFTFEFRFNPAKSPHMQGSVERLIGNIKAAMNKMKKFVSEWSVDLDDTTFRFVVVTIIGMMNNRPLCAVKIQGTTSYLTPNSFIMNRENNALCPPIDPPGSYDKLWSRYLDIQKVLWEHFVDHCVPQWITREKWLKPTKNFVIGEIVLTLDHRKMNEWRLARIIAIELGSNDQVRKLTLKLGNRHVQAISKAKGETYKDYADKLYDQGKCYKVTRAAAHVIKLDLYCEEAASIPTADELEELLED